MRSRRVSSSVRAVTGIASFSSNSAHAPSTSFCRATVSASPLRASSTAPSTMTYSASAGCDGSMTGLPGPSRVSRAIAPMRASCSGESPRNNSTPSSAITFSTMLSSGISFTPPKPPPRSGRPRRSRPARVRPPDGSRARGSGAATPEPRARDPSGGRTLAGRDLRGRPLRGGGFGGVKLMPELNIVEKVIALEGVELFRGLSPEQLARIGAIARETRLGPGKPVIEPSQPADALYVIVDGAVELARNGEALTVARQNDVLGAWALFDENEAMPVTARTLEDTRLLRIGRDDFYDLLSDNSEITSAIFSTLVGRFRKLVEQ